MDETHATLDFFGVAWRLGATLFFVLLNGFFVAAEFALVKVRVSRIEELAKGGCARREPCSTSSATWTAICRPASWGSRWRA